MKRQFLFAFLILLAFSSAQAVEESSAQDAARGFGLGIIVGEPTGLSGKGWLSGRTALQSAVAWSTDSNASLHLHLDYVVHRFDLTRVESGSLPIYFGIGGRFRVRDGADDDLGLRVPVGLDYLFEGAPVDLFLEIVPILNLVPDTDFDLNAAIGGRWFF